ncbi:hypothetical protein F7725_027274 [Dissostichus mawsoni]|uniref:Uncharacterized protein n=1 Tax=Dissostichus mawsoni TaxID=36200 RepID=A0A7J5XCF6_DISMA|nr:hypothetical protein F7725_027274 [Dissostichus mawsoni]
MGGSECGVMKGRQIRRKTHSHKPSKLSAARHLSRRSLLTPVVSCLYLFTICLRGPDLGSNTYLNGFRYLNMNSA